MLSEARRRALEIVRDHAPIGGSRFGYLMWQKHKRFDRSLRPQGAGFAGAGYLAKLCTAGLVEQIHTPAYCYEYRLTPEGRRALAGGSAQAAKGEDK